MKLSHYFLGINLLMFHAVAFPAMNIDVFDFKAKCMPMEDIVDSLIELPRDHSESTVPNSLAQYLIANDDLAGKAKNAYNSLVIVDRFFQQELNWDSFDNQASPLIMLTNFEDNDDGECGSLNAGIGASMNQYMTHDYAVVLKVRLGATQSYEDIGSDIDVLGHEFAHGIFSFTQEWDEGFDKQSINEGLGDVFGTTIRAWHESGQDLANTRIRSDSFNVGKNIGQILEKYYNQDVAAGTMRDNLQPHLDWPQAGADHYSVTRQENFHEVHSAGALIALAYARMVKGGTVSIDDQNINIDGLGFDKAIKIIFYVLKHQLPFNDMHDFANAVKKAATKIHHTDSDEVIAVHNALASVGLFSSAMSRQDRQREQQRQEQARQEQQQRQREEQHRQQQDSETEQPNETTPIPQPNNEARQQPEENAGQPIMSISGPMILVIFASFLLLLVISAKLISRNRRQQLAMQLSQKSNSSSISPGQNFNKVQTTAELSPREADNKTYVIKAQKGQSTGVDLTIDGQSYYINLTEQALTLGRSSELVLAEDLKAALKTDGFIARQHCQLWYKSLSNELYIVCLSDNGLDVDNNKLSKSNKAKLSFDHPVKLQLGKTLITLTRQF